jgi:hypothetical protein
MKEQAKQGSTAATYPSVEASMTRTRELQRSTKVWQHTLIASIPVGHSEQQLCLFHFERWPVATTLKALQSKAPVGSLYGDFAA